MADREKFEVAEIAFIGRTFHEYRHMFDFSSRDLLMGRILDCPSGAGSFVRSANERGCEVVGTDVMYEQSLLDVVARANQDYQAIADQLPTKTHLFNWTFYNDVETRIALLRSAVDSFIDDYRATHREGQYVGARLPDLPFDDDSFSLVLSAHFLFLYGDRLSYEFHRDCLLELVRVATAEVRVFPLVGLDTEPYHRLGELRSELQQLGIPNEERAVPFEFQTGANKMLVISG